MEYEDDGFASFGGLAYDNVPLDEAHVIIQGIPYEGGTSGKKGTSYAPEQIRLQSKDLQTISRNGIDLNYEIIKDMGNIPIHPLEGQETRNIIEKYCDYIWEHTNSPLISIGGDHSCTYPIIKSLSKNGKIGIIWFDAHRDLLPTLMHSQYSHGSPLGRAIELENVDPQDVLIIGTRYMQQDEQNVLKKNKISEIKMIDLESNNFNLSEYKQKIEEISKHVENIYVSIDIDVLDPAYAPGTGTPVSGGLQPRELFKLIWEIPCEIKAFDIMEVSPLLDHSNITVKAVLSLLTEIIAKLKTLRQEKR